MSALKPAQPNSPPETAPYLDMPPERRGAAEMHAAMLGASMRKIAAELPFAADVDDFRRVLVAEAE